MVPIVDKFLSLTDYKSGEPVFVRPSIIMAVSQLEAKTCESFSDNPPLVMKKRSRIDTAPTGMMSGPSYLVNESAEDIMATIIEMTRNDAARRNTEGRSTTKVRA